MNVLNWLLALVERLLVWFSVGREHAPALAPVRTNGDLGSTETGQPFALDRKDLARHCYLLGSTGCGKTTLILKLLERDIEAGHTVVVLDLRGDLVTGCIGLCRRLNVDRERVVLLDLREQSRVLGFNPLAGAGEPYIRALHVLDVLAAEAPSWGVQLEETLRNALLLLAHGKRSITELEAIFFDSELRSECLSKTCDQSLLAFWERYERMSPERQQSWALPVLNKVTPLLAVPVLRKVLGGGTSLDLKAILDARGSVLLVSLAVDELQRSARMLGSLLVSAIAREMMARVNVPEKRRNAVRLYIDEFENMASESFEGLIAEGRRFGLTLVLSHQTLSQLSARLRSVVRNNVGVQILFQVGFEDAKDLERELPEDVELENGLRSLEVGQAVVLFRDGSGELVQFAPPEKQAGRRATDEYRKELLARLPLDEPPKKSAPTVREDAARRAKAKNARQAKDLEEWL